MGSFSIWHWLIVLLVVVLIFGTKKLRNIGSDVGGAVKNFKDAMATEQGNTAALPAVQDTSNLIEAEVQEAAVVQAAPRKRAVAAKSAIKKTATQAAAKPKAPAKPRAAAKAK